MADVEYLTTVALPILEKQDCALVQLRFRREQPGWVMRLLVEKKGSDPMEGSGVTHEICSAISTELGDLLEEDAKMTMAYTLEVSSPGIERPLTCKDDYIRFLGRAAKIKTRELLDGKKKFQGVIGSLEEDTIQLESNNGKTVRRIPLEIIAKANLVFDNKVLKKRLGD